MATFSWYRKGKDLVFRGTGAMSLGRSATYPESVTYDLHKFQMWTTCPSTNTGISYEPFLVYTTLTGAGQVGGRARFFMTANVALGGWSNALKGEVTYGASGKTTGLGSAICAEMTLSAGTAGPGSYALYEAELNMPSGAKTGARTSMFWLSASGDDLATWVTNGYFMTLQGFGTASSTPAVFHTTGTVQATHGLRIMIDNVIYDILLKAVTYG